MVEAHFHEEEKGRRKEGRMKEKEGDTGERERMEAEREGLEGGRGWERKRERFKKVGIGSWNYGGQEVPRSALCKLENEGSWWCNLVQVQRPEKFQSELEGPGTRCSNVWGQEKGAYSPFLCIRPSAGWTRPTSIFFTQPTDSNANLLWTHPRRHTQK